MFVWYLVDFDDLVTWIPLIKDMKGDMMDRKLGVDMNSISNAISKNKDATSLKPC